LNAANCAGELKRARKVWKEFRRLNALCTTPTSAHSSDSRTVPPSSNMPTTVQVLWPRRSVLPRSNPLNSRTMPRPAMISFVPVRNIRPSAMRMLWRSATPAAEMPRSGRFARSPFERAVPSTTI